MNLMKRSLTPLLVESLKNFPAVFLNGPRQAGKSTLVQSIGSTIIQAEYVTLDDLSTLSFAIEDPDAFFKRFSGPVIIDEVQLAPVLFRTLKKRVDEIRLYNKSQAQGQFLLTGSANIMTIPELSDALVGRMEILTLLPLSVSESTNQETRYFINDFFDKNYNYNNDKVEKINLEEIISNATFPEIVHKDSYQKTKWYENYINTLLQRDVRSLSEIEKITALPNMLKLLANHSCGLLNDAALSRDTGLNTMTYRRYRTLLNAVFLITTIPPWFRNIGKRLVKSHKLYFTDTGLLKHILGVTTSDLKKNNPTLFGVILENFVATELMKQLTLGIDGKLYHFRTQDNIEVDFVIEKRNGNLIGIEVKSKETIRPEDFKSLKILKEQVGADFITGILLYCGEKIIPFGDNLIALPISAVFGNHPKK